MGYILPSYIHYHLLPDEENAAFNKVMLVLGNAATMYTKKHGKIPVLVIDGVDLLGKSNVKLCCALIVYAKVLANAKMLKLVLLVVRAV